MLLRISLFLVMALGLSGFATVAWLDIRSPQAPQTQPEPPPFRSLVIAAAHTLRSGTLLRPEDLSSLEMPPNSIPHGARRDTPGARNEVLGALVRHPIGAGQLVLPDDIVRPGDHGFLASVLAPGTRAVAVGVDAVAGTAGLIWPGDRVDIILTQSLDDKDAAPGRRIAGETMLHDVRVIAIDQDLTQGATAGAVPGGGAPNARPASRTVTLEVTPTGAERVAVAMRLGHLSLSVIAADTPAEGDITAPSVPPTARPGSAQAASPAAQITWGGDVSPALSGGHSGGRNAVRVFLGASEGTEFKF
jgi:pilus assembly protein CpaB